MRVSSSHGTDAPPRHVLSLFQDDKGNWYCRVEKRGPDSKGYSVCYTDTYDNPSEALQRALILEPLTRM